MRRRLLLACLMLLVGSCSRDLTGPDDTAVVPPSDAPNKEPLLTLHSTLTPGIAPNEVLDALGGPSGFVIDPGAFPEIKKGMRARLSTTLYNLPAEATFDFDAYGLYRVEVRVSDLTPVHAEEVRESVDAYYAAEMPSDTPDPETGWTLGIDGISAQSAGVMSTGWELDAAAASSEVFLAGKPDGFQAPYDPSNQNPDIVDYIVNNWLGQGIREFDQPGNNLALVHRFTGLPDGPYCDVRLLIRLRGQTSSLSSNDSIRLIFPAYGEGTEPFAWWRPIRAFTGTWGVGRDITLSIDLGDLPNDVDYETSILDRISGNVLDVVVEDDTAVDFMMLKVLTDQHRGHGSECGAS